MKRSSSPVKRSSSPGARTSSPVKRASTEVRRIPAIVSVRELIGDRKSDLANFSKVVQAEDPASRLPIHCRRKPRSFKSSNSAFKRFIKPSVEGTSRFAKRRRFHKTEEGKRKRFLSKRLQPKGDDEEKVGTALVDDVKNTGSGISDTDVDGTNEKLESRGGPTRKLVSRSLSFRALLRAAKHSCVGADITDEITVLQKLVECRIDAVPCHTEAAKSLTNVSVKVLIKGNSSLTSDSSADSSGILAEFTDKSYLLLGKREASKCSHEDDIGSYSASDLRFAYRLIGPSASAVTASAFAIRDSSELFRGVNCSRVSSLDQVCVVIIRANGFISDILCSKPLHESLFHHKHVDAPFRGAILCGSQQLIEISNQLWKYGASPLSLTMGFS